MRHVRATQSTRAASIVSPQRGRAVCLVSGGIDSPVALWLTMIAGIMPIPVFFDSYPLADRRGREIALKGIKQVREYLRAAPLKTYVVEHGSDASEIVASCQRNLACVISRRMMFRIARVIANREAADSIVTGDVVGQKASQTLHNLFVTDSAAAGFPIIRPLVGMNKDEIERLSRIVGTFQTSVSPGVSACGIPTRKPRTRSHPDEIAESESRLAFDHMAERSVESAQILEV